MVVAAVFALIVVVALLFLLQRLQLWLQVLPLPLLLLLQLSVIVAFAALVAPPLFLHVTAQERNTVQPPQRTTSLTSL